MSEKKQSITRIYKERNSVTELDMIVKDEILGKDWSESDYPDKIEIGNTNNNWEREADAIRIDEVIYILQDMKSKGCNYVEIMNHSDHYGYYFNGLDIHASTPKEIKEEKERKKELERKNAESEIKKLEEKISKLKKSL